MPADSQTHWLQISAEVSHLNLSDAETALLDSGAVSITLTDAADQPILEPAPGETPTWDQCIITGLYAEPNLQTEILTSLQNTLAPLIDGQLKAELLEDKNWVRAWMENFTAMPFGKHLSPEQQLWICPSHIEPPEPTASNIHLDPGMAFGTGTHATTALCLEWIANHPQTGKTVIDYGCGSGLLGIAALKRGAEHCYGVDIDPQAIIASQDNAEKNQLAKQLTLNLSDDLEPADIVYANILANTLIQLYDRIARLCKPNGYIVLSGILNEQVDEVINCYQQGFNFEPPEIQDDWACLSAIKKV